MPRFKGTTGEESTIEESQGSESRKQARISLPLTETGTIDWSKVTDRTRNRFAQGVSSDPEAMQLIGLRAQTDASKPDPLLITEDHVKDFLDGYGQMEAWIAPSIIAQRSNGRIKISPEIAAAAYTFTDEQKNRMAPSGAEWANDALPPWLKKLLLSVSAGAKFAGLLMFCTMQQTKTALTMWAQTQNQNAPPNGETQPHTVSTGGQA